MAIQKLCIRDNTSGLWMRLRSPMEDCWTEDLEEAWLFNTRSTARGAIREVNQHNQGIPIREADGSTTWHHVEGFMRDLDMEIVPVELTIKVRN